MQGTGGPIDEHGLKLRLKPHVIPWNHFDLLPIGATESPLTSLAAGAPAAAEQGLTTSNLAAIKLTTADIIQAQFDLAEEDWDLSLDLMADIRFSCATSTAASGIVFDLFVKGLAKGETYVDPVATFDKQLTFPAYTTAGQNKLEITPRLALGIPGTFAADRKLIVAVKMTDDGTAAGDDICFTSLVLWGTRAIMSASGVRETT